MPWILSLGCEAEGILHEELLKISDLRVAFQTEEGRVRAVNGVSLALDRGRTLGLVGESGCGKSVTALAVLRLIRPPGAIEGGQINLNGTDVLSLDEQKMCAVRGGIASMVFQEPMTSLNPVYSVGDQVAEAVTAHEHVSAREARDRAIEMFRLVGLPQPEARYRAYPHEFSGGMRQRVMIAMALVCRPRLLIADEPTSALDVTIQAQILELINDLRQELGMALLLISHDLGVIAETVEDVAVMYAGEVVEMASARALFGQPLHPYTKALLASIPTLDISRSEPLKAIRGSVVNPLRLPDGCYFAPRCPSVAQVCWERHPILRTARGDVPATGSMYKHQVRCWLSP
ncbi:MAG: ABC transporter ATP-binding protein [Acidobacteria bacterium]|nr:ABC transporter ATP-binding protein [Acidobacteriota bacterium]